MPKLPQFRLSIQSLTPSSLPERLPDTPASEFRSPLIPSVAAATSPLIFIISLPCSRVTDPLYPATHLQLSYKFEGSGDVFVPDVITSQDLVRSGSEDGTEKLYSVQLAPKQIPRPKVNKGATSDAEVFVYAWRREKLLGRWTVGCIQGLGLEGLKSHPLALLRRDTWAAQRRG